MFTNKKNITQFTFPGFSGDLSALPLNVIADLVKKAKKGHIICINGTEGNVFYYVYSDGSLVELGAGGGSMNGGVIIPTRTDFDFGSSPLYIQSPSNPGEAFNVSENFLIVFAEMPEHPLVIDFDNGESGHSMMWVRIYWDSDALYPISAEIAMQAAIEAGFEQFYTLDNVTDGYGLKTFVGNDDTDCLIISPDAQLTFHAVSEM